MELQFQNFDFLISNFRLKGLVLDWYTRTSGALRAMIRENGKMFTSKADFVDHCSSKVSLGVDLENLQNIFVFFFGCLLFILVVAIVVRKRSLLLAIMAKLISEVKNLFAIFYFKIKRTISKICDLVQVSWSWFLGKKFNGQQNILKVKQCDSK